MSCIDDLPDDLPVKILSSIPTKDVVATSLLSKRWESLWTIVRRLEYDQEYHYDKRTGFSSFVDKSLLSYQSPVLESLNFKFKSRLLSKCPLLADLMVEERQSNAMSKLNIAVPSLQRLSIRTVIGSDKEFIYFSYDKDIPKVVINVPSLKYLTIDDRGMIFMSLRTCLKLWMQRSKLTKHPPEFS
ncbi:PREDICTED: putative F-box/FBD/LRR-repeat protein At3g56780 [Camelina sativa]|uniref:F-box/FBD/LRR-repeat protein At3g56780 n=1 Tax=Camelina sativa TaxID=90675 RepID=A0ABM1R9F9_CAMSA|nr:PREDICTED: putative F-box/FBD/LRR-repeat protein At3g56780 [Camelina sativa]